MGRNAMNILHAKFFCLNAKQTTRPSIVQSIRKMAKKNGMYNAAKIEMIS
jgi:hypothetical protein